MHQACKSFFQRWNTHVFIYYLFGTGIQESCRADIVGVPSLQESVDCWRKY